MYCRMGRKTDATVFYEHYNTDWIKQPNVWMAVVPWANKACNGLNNKLFHDFKTACSHQYNSNPLVFFKSSSYKTPQPMLSYSIMMSFPI